MGLERKRRAGKRLSEEARGGRAEPAHQGAFSHHATAAARLKQKGHDQICVSKAHFGADSGTAPSLVRLNGG